MTKQALWAGIFGMLSAITSYSQGSALRFDGTNDYVNCGPTNALGASSFTIETWFIIQSNGTATTTGAGGVPDAIPLLSKGAQQAEGGVTNMNYFLGYDQSALQLVADFEEADNGATPG